LCGQPIDPADILLTLAGADPAAGAPLWRRRLIGPTCLDCLAEAVHDAADLIEGAARRPAESPYITPPPADG